MRKVLYFFGFLFTILSFLPTAIASAESENSDIFSFSESISLEIDAKNCTLTVYKCLSDGSKEIVQKFPVATARSGIAKFPFGKGKITRVDLDPYWYPTATSVDYMNKKLINAGKKPLFKKGEAIGPRDPRNAMGTFKMHLSHFVPEKGTIYRIHGTNSPSSIGKRVSSGCIRMQNETGFALAKNIKQRLKRGEKIEVDII